MVRTKRIKTYSVILLIITSAYIFFIWYRSTLSAEDSTVESTSVLRFLEKFLNSLDVNFGLTDFMVRKAAHFCEFALLGCLVMWTHCLLFSKAYVNLISTAAVCLTTAAVDEIIQIFSPGRSCQITDVILDFCGAFAGAVIFLIIFAVYRLIKTNKDKEKR